MYLHANPGLWVVAGSLPVNLVGVKHVKLKLLPKRLPVAAITIAIASHIISFIIALYTTNSQYNHPIKCLNQNTRL